MTGYLPVGFELAVEITYPEPGNKNQKHNLIV